MNKIQIANILLTRRCNLRCDYCSIVQDYENKPKCYPDISYYENSELTSIQWMSIFSRLKANNPDVFIILYGGEPLLYKGLDELVKFCKREHINYTIISNNTKLIQSMIQDLVNEVGILDGFTASIDPELAKFLGKKISNKNHSIKKTIEGYENLKKLKAQKIASDVVAEITVTSKNIEYLFDTVNILSEAGIYSSITTIDLRKNPYYDFSTITDESLLVPKEESVLYEFYRLIDKQSLLIHIPQLLLKLYEILPCSMKCAIYDDIHNVTIDVDGSFRLCLRIRGEYAPSVKIDNIIDEKGRVNPFFNSALKKDYCDYCEGCNHTCLLISEYFSNQILNH